MVFKDVVPYITYQDDNKSVLKTILADVQLKTSDVTLDKDCNLVTVNPVYMVFPALSIPVI
jgi:hypothetical protein